MSRPSMSVTLEVSKLSGWLKAAAPCRVQRRHPAEGMRVAHTEEKAHRGEVESGARAACVWPTAQECGQKAQARKRTKNMELMSVTLEVSKLSGWLKADADCRVEGRACDAEGGEVRAGRREDPGWWRHTRGMHGDRPDSRLGGQGHARSARRTCKPFL